MYLSIIFTFFVIKLYNIMFIYLCMCFSSSHCRDYLSFIFVLCLLSTSVLLFLQFMHFGFPCFSLLGNPGQSLTFSLISWFWFLPQFRKIPETFPQNLFSFMCGGQGGRCNSVCILSFQDCFFYSECNFFRVSYYSSWI